MVEGTARYRQTTSMGVIMSNIPDLHFIVYPIASLSTRRGYALAFYRYGRNDYGQAWGTTAVTMHKSGKPYVYHFETFFGDHGGKLRSEAIRRGRAVQQRRESMGLRDVSRTDCYTTQPLKDLGIFIPTRSDPYPIWGDATQGVGKS